MNNGPVPPAYKRICAQRWPCTCSPHVAAEWIADLTTMARAGDVDARRLLPVGVEHLLAAWGLETAAP